MTSRPLARRLAPSACACASAVLILAGCTTSAASNTGATVTGGTLSIYVSVPPGALTPQAQDVLDAERLAYNQFKESGGKVGRFKLRLLRFRGRKFSDTAREAIGDATTIAYLGEIVPGASADTIGITNAQDVLQVSPTDTAVELTHSTPAIPNTPTRYYEALSTYGRTFARVVPTDALEAAAVVAQTRALRVKSVYVATDGSEYGRALKYAFVSRAGSALSVASSDSTADAVFYAGSSATGAASVFDGAAAGNPKVTLFASSALNDNAFAASLSPAARRGLYVSSPGFTSGEEPAAARQFDSAFQAAYGHPPVAEAVFGYAAMAAVIHALQKAGSSAGNRKTVVQRFFSTTNLSTAIGAVTIGKDGDVSFAGGAPFVFSRVKSGRLVPEKAAHEQG
jgi:branched-chain amino acid transport system substrate-binding protein